MLVEAQASLPTRERGLKFCIPMYALSSSLSLPTRERGLKLLAYVPCILAIESLPTRERGLKSVNPFLISYNLIVAPYTGAWIEMLLFCFNGKTDNVAPYTGAWIEMSVLALCLDRGSVAPYTGAWIEIDIQESCPRQLKSLPTRERGLKFIRIFN